MRASKRAKAKLWIGLVHGKIHFYRDPNYYNGVRHADLFSTKRAAKQCYEDVRPLTKRERGGQA